MRHIAAGPRQNGGICSHNDSFGNVTFDETRP